MKKTAVAVTLLVTILTAIDSYAQDFSNKGKEFFIVYPEHIDQLSSVMGVYITSDVSTTGTLEAGGTTVPFTVTANQVSTIFIGPGGSVPNGPVYLNIHDAITPNGSIKVTSERDIIVYAHIIHSARSGATLVLPTKVWGREYVVPSHRNTGGNASFGEFVIVASKPNTTVEIVPSITGRPGFPDAGRPYQITLLNPGDTYLFQGATNDDISGTTIRSVQAGGEPCKPIGVFSATTWSGFDCTNASGGDNLFQQLFPTGAWGKVFVTAPFINRPYDIIRVYVDDPFSFVQKTEAGITSTLSNYNTIGKYYEFKTASPTMITSNVPVQVAQFIVSQTCGSGTPSDPEMTMLNPIDQTLDNITLFSAHANSVPPGQTQVSQHYLNIIIPTAKAGSLLIDNAPPPGSFIPIPGTNFSYLQADVTGSSASNPVHNIKADTGFIAIAYGYGNVESYGYNAGTNVVDRYQFISLENQYATINYPASCVNTPFYFNMTFPYEPDTIRWQFFGSFPDVTIPNPTYDETWTVDGRPLYKYKLPGTYSYTNPGTYPVRVIAVNPTTDGCSGVQQIDWDVEILARPTANYTYTSSGCPSDTVYFTDLSNSDARPVAKWKWNFGDGGIDSTKDTKHKYNAAGSYTVTHSFITEMGCVSDTASQIITLANPPVAKFGVSAPTCIGSTITFSDSSAANAGSTLAKWYWDFGDGTLLTALNNSSQSHVYNTAGTYTVTLIVETTTGCKSFVFSHTLTIHPKPLAAFTFTGACLPTGTTQFTDQSTISDGSQAQFTYNWNFGDLGTSTQQNPSHNYTTSGPFNVVLTVTSNNGCVDDSMRVMNLVYPRPDADFTVDSLESCLGGTFNFTSTSTAPNSTVQSYFWDFGDNTTSNQANPNKQYAGVGTYTVRLYIISAAGCISDTAEKQVTVLQLPNASFTVSNPLCELGSAQFTSTSVPNAGVISQYNWTVNSTPTGGNNSVITYVPSAAGSYVVQLSVVTDKGCRGQASSTINVNPKPNAGFGTPVICMPAGTAPFNNTSTISGGGTLTYQWNFGDNNTSTQTNPVHTYAGTGPYTVQLIATSTAGCADTATQNLTTIYAQPQAAFTAAAEVCSGATVTFTDQSSAPNNTVTGWVWNFGDNTTSSAQHPTHTYAAPGTYTVTLVVTSQAGCPSTIATRQVVVNPLPTANFTISTPHCVGQQITFVNASQANAGNIVEWTWDYGDGSQAVLTNGNPHTHVYSTTGNYTATLKVRTDKGCVSTVFSRPVVISPLPQPAFTMPESCLNDPFSQFTDQSTIVDGTQAQFTYLWTFDDPNDATPSTQKDGRHKYTAVGIYDVSLTVTSNNGCAATVTQPFTLNGGSPQSIFTVQGGTTLCSDQDVTITNNSIVDFGNVVKLEVFWDYANDPTNKITDDNPSAGKTYTYHYPPFGAPATRTVSITVVAYSGDNCLSTSTQQITLQAKPEIQFSPVAGVCEDVSSFQLVQAAEVNGLPGSGTFSGRGVSPTGLFDPAEAGPGRHNIRYTFVSTAGCTSYAETVVEVFALPVANAGPDRVVLEGGNIALLGNLSTGNGLSYLWTPATGLDNTGIASPKASPTTDMFYKLTVTTADGCVDDDEVFVKILLKPIIPNAFSPNGDGINDKWEITALDSYPGAVVEVYNRYGQVLYRSVGYTKAWDGKYNGKDVPAGTYYYIVDPKNGRQRMAGFVDVLR